MENLLTLIAELSIGIAGFTAIFSVLDRGPASRESTLQVLRVRQMLLGGVGAAGSCVLALGLLASPLAAVTIWRIAASAVVSFILGLMIFIARQIRGQGMAQMTGWSQSHASVVWGMGLVSLVLMVLTIVFAAEPIAPDLFGAGIIGMFAVSSIQFVRAAMKQLAVVRED